MPRKRVHYPLLRPGAGAGSDWLRWRAASSLRTCALAPRRGRGGAGARWFRAGLPRTGLDGRLRPRLRVLRAKTWRAEAPLQRGTEPATQAQRLPPLLPQASRAAPLRVRRSGHRLGCGRPEGWGLRGRPRAAAPDLQTAELGGPRRVSRPGAPLPSRPSEQPALGDTVQLRGAWRWRPWTGGVRPAVRFSVGKLVPNVFLKNCLVEAVHGLLVTRFPSVSFPSQTSGSDGLGLAVIDMQSRWMARPFSPTLSALKSSPSLSEVTDLLLFLRFTSVITACVIIND